MRVCVIPARGGSVRIPGKNIKEFCGKPIIAYSIEAAINSKIFDEVIVSTDDLKIAEVAKSFGAKIPFIRPNELSDNYVGTTPVIKHAIEWLNSNDFMPSIVCCLYATAPFVSKVDLKRGLDTLNNNNADYAFSVTNYAFPIQRALRLTQNQRVEMREPSAFDARSQDLEEMWHDAGQFYWGLTRAWLADNKIFSECSAAVPLPNYKVRDIDTLEDWKQAELMFKAYQMTST